MQIVFPLKRVLALHMIKLKTLPSICISYLSSGSEYFGEISVEVWLIKCCSYVEKLENWRQICSSVCAVWNSIIGCGTLLLATKVDSVALDQ